MLRHVTTVFWVLTLVFLSAAAASATSWSITNLGPNYLPTGINASGQIVGAVSTSNLGSAMPDYGSEYTSLAAGMAIAGNAFLWSNGTASSLGGVPAGYSSITAYGINSSGTIVGDATDAQGNDYAMVYSGGAWQALGGTMATANGINDNGAIVGQTTGSSPNAYVLTGGVGGTQMNIGGMQAAYAVNNNGVVVGGDWNPIDPNGGNYPQYYDGPLTSYQSANLHAASDVTQGPNPDGRFLAVGPGASSSAEMGGMVVSSSGPTASYYTVAAGSTTGPGTWSRTTPPTGGNSNTTENTDGLYGIDANGDAVGSASFKSTNSKYSDGNAIPSSLGSTHLGAFLYTAGGTMKEIDLNTYIPSTDDWVLQCARAISVVGNVPDGNGVNHTGEEWIVGFGVGPDGNEDGFLLTPTLYTPVATPEPSTLLLAATGLLGLLACAWRKRR